MSAFHINLVCHSDKKSDKKIKSLAKRILNPPKQKNKNLSVKVLKLFASVY